MSDEHWDLRDRDGEKTGEMHRRGVPLPEGRFHIVASVCAVRDDGRMLLTQRAEGKTYPLSWEIPAGSILTGETSEEGAVRELGEETGIRVATADLHLIGRIIEPSALFDLYAVHVSGDPVVTPQQEEVADYIWATLDELDARVADRSLAAPWLTRLETFRHPLVSFLGRTTG